MLKKKITYLKRENKKKKKKKKKKKTWDGHLHFDHRIRYVTIII